MVLAGGSSGSGSGVERLLAKEKVEGSNPFSRSKKPLIPKILTGAGLRLIKDTSSVRHSTRYSPRAPGYTSRLGD